MAHISIADVSIAQQLAKISAKVSCFGSLALFAQRLFGILYYKYNKSADSIHSVWHCQCNNQACASGMILSSEDVCRAANSTIPDQVIHTAPEPDTYRVCPTLVSCSFVEAAHYSSYGEALEREKQAHRVSSTLTCQPFWARDYLLRWTLLRSCLYIHRTLMFAAVNGQM